MSLAPLFTHFFLMLAMQFGGLTELEPGQGYDFTVDPQYTGGLPAEIFYQVRLTEIPVEDYYTCEAALYMGSDTPFEVWTIAGYQSEDEINVFSFISNTDINFYSVNEAGGPFVLPKYRMEEVNWYSDAPEFPFRTFYSSTAEEAVLDYITHHGDTSSVRFGTEDGFFLTPYFAGEHRDELNAVDITMEEAIMRFSCDYVN